MKPVVSCYNAADGTNPAGHRNAADGSSAMMQMTHGVVRRPLQHTDDAPAKKGFCVCAADTGGHDFTTVAPKNDIYLSDSSGGFIKSADDMAELSAPERDNNFSLSAHLLMTCGYWRGA